MEGHELLTKVTKVSAPGDFEAKVLARLPAARTRRARQAMYRYALAGTAAVALAAFLVFRPATTEQPTVLTFAERQALTATPGQGGRSAAGPNRIVPVYETMDYASEFRKAQSQPATVYILEQVSEVPLSEIIY